MNLRPIGGYKDLPVNAIPADAHLGLSFDYEFAGKPMGEQVSLLVHSWIIDHAGAIYSRKATYIIPRPNAVSSISSHIKTHLISLGVDDMSCRRLLRDLVINKEKAISYEALSDNFSRTGI